MPLFLRFPAVAVGSSALGQKLAAVTAINQHLGLDLQHLAPTLHLDGVDALPLAVHSPQHHAIEPLQGALGIAPLAQDRLRRGGSIAKAAHPVVVEAFRFSALQFPQECPPARGRE